MAQTETELPRERMVMIECPTGLFTSGQVRDGYGRLLTDIISRAEWSLDAGGVAHGVLHVEACGIRAACVPDWILTDPLVGDIALPDGLTVEQVEAISRAWRETVGALADEVRRLREEVARC